MALMDIVAIAIAIAAFAIFYTLVEGFDRI